ncbi:MAG: polyhydroxyalkanoic acid system family protein [Ignavibacteria bacterium]|nr:polyhydroxyalkanoic acid system family protein [Ignavibacteria bacterium]
MARLSFTIETGKSVPEMKSYIDTRLLSRPESRMLLTHHHWNGNVLHAKGTLGEGTITLEHQRIVIDIELTAFGEIARSQIQRTLEREFTQIGR